MTNPYHAAMPRTARRAPKGWIYHALNRAVARLPLFEGPADYEAFERVIVEAQTRVPLEILAYCLMPNHWHFVLRPVEEGQLTAFLRWLTHTHTMRFHADKQTSGTGHLYQGRFKAFPVEEGNPFCTLVRYVESNALRNGLVTHAERWCWSSLWRYELGGPKAQTLLTRWPVRRPRDWVTRVNKPMPESELDAVRQSVRRSCPFGTHEWQVATADRMGLQSTLRPRGRPRKQEPS
jgi:putative transposase